MDASAALLNDVAKSVYTYPIQLPYLNIALQELQESYELNEMPVTDTISAVMIVAAGLDHISFTAQGTLILPNDLVEPQVLWERATGVNPYIPMTKVDLLPRYMEGTTIPEFIYYTWQANEIRFLAASQANDIKMDYIRNLFPVMQNTAGMDQISVINATSFLEFRNAALCAHFIGENKTRSDELNGFAALSLDKIIGIGIKGRQSIITRHRPFRSSYKRRSFM